MKNGCTIAGAATFLPGYGELGGGFFGDDDGDEASALSAVLELDDAGDLGEEGVILASADIEAGLKRGSALADEDGASGDGFAAEALDAEPLRI